ncbi:MAG TPA: SAM-dependent methyltransferase [Acidobacteriaceae bacterium]|nr:SAM-dependent methyltransferase [Acidobacteriaceae bacterium]
MIFQSKTSADFFEDRYRKKADPWGFTFKEYEQNRFATIVAALSGKRYRRAFEPGCSIGTLTERLAPICDHIDACDFSPTAVDLARQRCAALPNVHLSCAALTGKTPLAGYDLILFSEIGYYFRLGKWRSMVAALATSMDPGATVLASHWLGHSDDHRIEGDQVHEVLRADPRLRLDFEQRHEGFRLDRFVRL